MKRFCCDCGEEINESMGSVVAGDHLKFLRKEIPTEKIRERCGKCVLKIIFERDRKGGVIMSGAKKKKFVDYLFLHVLVVVVLVFTLVLVDGFTGVSSKIGPFVWYVILPVVVITGSLFFFGFLGLKRLFRGRKEIPTSELKDFL